jgi:hypothetical protein
LDGRAYVKFILKFQLALNFKRGMYNPSEYKFQGFLVGITCPLQRELSVLLESSSLRPDFEFQLIYVTLLDSQPIQFIFAMSVSFTAPSSIEDQGT